MRLWTRLLSVQVSKAPVFLLFFFCIKFWSNKVIIYALPQLIEVLVQFRNKARFCLHIFPSRNREKVRSLNWLRCANVRKAAARSDQAIITFHQRHQNLFESYRRFIKHGGLLEIWSSFAEFLVFFVIKWIETFWGNWNIPYFCIDSATHFFEAVACATASLMNTDYKVLL